MKYGINALVISKKKSGIKLVLLHDVIHGVLAALHK